MDINNDKNINYDTLGSVEKRKFKKFIIIFAAVMLLLVIVGVFALLRHYDYNFSGVVQDPESAETDVSEEHTSMAVITGAEKWLLCCTSDADNTFRYAVLFSVDLDDKALTLTPLMVDDIYENGDCSGTMKEQVDYGGMKQLVGAVENVIGCKINRYVRCKDSGFRSVMTSFGSVSVKVDKQIDVRQGELIAIFSPGVQNMNGETLLKYIRCFEDDPHKQCEILAEIFRQKITEENSLRADSLYEVIINRVESDISAFDFNSMKPAFSALAAADNGVKVIVN